MLKQNINSLIKLRNKYLFNFILLILIAVFTLSFILAIPMRAQPDYQNLIQTFNLNSISQYTPLNFIGPLELPYLDCSGDFIGYGHDLKFRSEATCFNENKHIFFDRAIFFVTSFSSGIAICSILTLFISIFSKKKLIHDHWLIPLIFPMISWGLSFYSLESMFLLISCFTIYLVHRFKFFPIWILCIPILFFIDRGNFFAIILYIFLYLFFLIALNFLKFKNCVFLALLGILFALTYFETVLFFLLEHIELLRFGEVIDSLSAANDLQSLKGGSTNVLISLSFTLVSFIFLTTDHYWPYSLVIAIISLIVLYFTKYIKIDFKKIKNKIFYRRKIIFAYLAPLLLTPIIIISILPTHSYAKYYLFCYVPLFAILRILLPLKPLLIILCLLNLSISLEFMLRFYSISI